MKPIYVIGHKSPDADSVASAVSYAYLLNQLGKKAIPLMSGKANRETEYAFHKLGMKLPSKRTDASSKQFVLVDHSDSMHAISHMKEATILGIIDHHEPGDLTSSFMRCAPMGSTVSLIYLLFQEHQIEIPKKIAQVMLVGFISDTSNGKRKMTEEDYAIYEDLKKRSSLDVDTFYQGMKDACSYDGMKIEEIFSSDYKEYQIGSKKIGISCLKGMTSKESKHLLKKLSSYVKKEFSSFGMDLIFLKIDNKEKGFKEKVYLMGFGEGSISFLESMASFDGTYYVLEKRISRKLDLVPMLKQYLDEKEN